MSSSRKHRHKYLSEQTKELFRTALTSGANHIGKEILEAVNDVNQPSDIVYEKLFAALKNGAFATGLELVREGFRSR